MKVFDFLARLAQMVLDAAAAVLGICYTAKYTVIIRRLGLAKLSETERPGLLIIQIDGLSYEHLHEAMKRGYAPHLRRLWQQGEVILRPWYVGLPCTTPATQAGIMFGNNEDIPGFRWYIKEAQRAITCTSPNAIAEIQRRISQGRRGILKGGSSFMNMFDGDASLSMFTLGAMNRQRFFESVRGLGFFLLFLLNPFRTVKTLFVVVWEYFQDVVQRVSALLRKDKVPHLLKGTSLFLRIMGDVIFREVQTFAVMIDIYRGVPAIYTTYYGYDEVAHHYGPLSKPALRALRAIDARVRRIDSFRRRSLTRDYDLYILSDHGMTSAVPFRKAYGQSLGDFIRGLVGKRARLSESLDIERRDVLHAIYLKEELQAIESNVRPALARVPHRLAEIVRERFGLDGHNGKEASLESLREADVVVRNSGSMSHVYLNVGSKQLSLSEIEEFFPGLAQGLLAHPGIWLVIGREGETVIVSSREGKLFLDGEYRVLGRDPLEGVASPRVMADFIRRMARFPHAGDLILMGRYEPKTEIVSCFEEQWACHGGLGGPQEVAFLMVEKHVPWEAIEVRQATDLYQFFKERYSGG